MSSRLLSFLNLIQDSISRRSGEVVQGTRQVNFNKGIARLSLKDGGSILVQCYVLADGQSCVKVALFWPECEEAAYHAVYPTARDFDWDRSAGRIAQAWVDGPIAAGIVPASLRQSGGLSKLVAAS